MLPPAHRGGLKLLAATEPERLAAALLRALPSWEWNLQDLVVSELSRLDVRGTAGAFTAAVMEAQPMVVPMMLDQIGLAQETAAVPVLLQIAAGENDRLRDIFTRIKAIEALGRCGCGRRQTCCAPCSASATA